VLDHGADLALAVHDRGELAGVILAEAVAGAEGTAAVTGVSVHPARRRRGLGTALVAAACDRLRSRGTRLVIAEMPGDPALAPALKLFLACRFTEAGRIRNFYRERVDLIILERRLSR
jgi:ribosomal protein S18 acetylase RimI-like enzyme